MKPCIILLGPPGSGKGSQTEKLKSFLAFQTVSTGDLVRSQIKGQTPIGLEIEPFLKEGRLVPDELIVQLFKEWIKDNQDAKGFILDGFPRTLEQASIFNKDIVGKFNLKVQVVYLEVSVDLLISRMLTRLICNKCKTVYNTTSKPPKHLNQCDECGEHLERRQDDNPETIVIRNKEYMSLTAPLVEFFLENLVTINGDQDSEKVFSDIIKGLNSGNLN
jgi:adenylate kinase